MTQGSSCSQRPCSQMMFVNGQLQESLPSTAFKIIQRLRGSGEICTPPWKPSLNTGDLWPLRQHCFKTGFVLWWILQWRLGNRSENHHQLTKEDAAATNIQVKTTIQSQSHFPALSEPGSGLLPKSVLVVRRKSDVTLWKTSSCPNCLECQCLRVCTFPKTQ